MAREHLFQAANCVDDLFDCWKVGGFFFFARTTNLVFYPKEYSGSHESELVVIRRNDEHDER